MLRLSILQWGRARWAQLDFTRIHIELIILREKIEENPHLLDGDRLGVLA